MTKSLTTLTKIAMIGLVASSLSACVAGDRLRNVGKEPEFTPIRNPIESKEAKQISLPMPAPQTVSYQPNSLWQSGSRTFFKDQRANKVGDILTVNIDIADKAELDNATTRERDNSEAAGITGMFGLPGVISKRLPGSIDPATELADFGSTSSSTGSGSIDREEKIELTVAAYITQILPNGNMVIFGRQEVRVNFEKRELFITGIIRPEDITNQNTIEHTQIAEARVAYGGKGHISDIQQPRYGQQVFDILMPF